MDGPQRMDLDPLNIRTRLINVPFDQKWDILRGELEDLWLRQPTKLSLKKVMQIMLDRYQFNAKSG